MGHFRVGFIGTGKKPEKCGPKGYAMAYRHAAGYQLLDDCDIVACADIAQENADAFAQEHGVANTYLDYHDMLAKEKLDIVSICTWPKLHASMTIDCIEAGVPAIHCEKPMALTYGECRKMLEFAQKEGTKLTFNHQRRFGAPFRNAKKLLNDGVVGDLVRMEAHVGDLYDGGVHWVDMLNYFNNETPPCWVIGQIDCRKVRLVFGAPCEYQSISHVQYRNGVTALIITGSHAAEQGPPFRLLGTTGTIEIGWKPKPGPMLKYWSTGSPDWVAVDCGKENLHGPGYIERAIIDVTECLRTGRVSELCAENEMKAMDIVFGCYESSRRRGRVDFPMKIEDSPIQDLIDSGAVKARIID